MIKYITILAILGAVLFIGAPALARNHYRGEVSLKSSNYAIHSLVTASLTPRPTPSVSERGENRNERAKCQVRAKDAYLAALKAARVQYQADRDKTKFKEARRLARESFKKAKNACKKTKPLTTPTPSLTPMSSVTPTPSSSLTPTPSASFTPTPSPTPSY